MSTIDALYRERACLVAHLAALYPSVLAYNDTAEPEWSVLYMDTPRGQCSWHINPDDLALFHHVPTVPVGDPRAVWDGHTTTQKYIRLVELTSDTDLGKKVGEEIREYKRPGGPCEQ